MKNTTSFYLVIFAILSLFSLGITMDYERTSSEAADGENEIELNSPFDKMMAVLTHQRCVNCHPAGDVPRKGDDSHVTRALGISGGEHGHGLEGISCNTCHVEENNNFSGVPGAPDWALAPLSMAWEGLSRVEIATSMLDRSKNGNRSLDDIVKHLTEHELVLWAWEPGVNSEGIPREKPPVPKDEYIAAVKELAANGAIIPAE